MERLTGPRIMIRRFTIVFGFALAGMVLAGCGSTGGLAGGGAPILLTSNVTGAPPNPISLKNVFVLDAGGVLSNLNHFTGGDEGDPHYSPDGSSNALIRQIPAGV